MGMRIGGNGKPGQLEWELPALPWEYISYSLKRTPIDVLHI